MASVQSLIYRPIYDLHNWPLHQSDRSMKCYHYLNHPILLLIQCVISHLLFIHDLNRQLFREPLILNLHLITKFLSFCELNMVGCLLCYFEF